jgi:hypothetical protein
MPGQTDISRQWPNKGREPASVRRVGADSGAKPRRQWRTAVASDTSGRAISVRLRRSLIGMAVGFNVAKPSAVSLVIRSGKFTGPCGQSQTNNPMPAACSASSDFAPHQTGDGGASVDTAGAGLNMLGQAPIEFALYQQIQRLCQLLRNDADLSRRRSPVLSTNPVAATDRLLQQRHGDKSVSPQRHRL